MSPGSFIILYFICGQKLVWWLNSMGSTVHHSLLVGVVVGVAGVVDEGLAQWLHFDLLFY